MTFAPLPQSKTTSKETNENAPSVFLENNIGHYCMTHRMSFSHCDLKEEQYSHGYSAGIRHQRLYRKITATS
tara:strand:- start:338 stop:553 length:216 start_codon:yes stop_codon:yes gene_type:complete